MRVVTARLPLPLASAARFGSSRCLGTALVLALCLSAPMASWAQSAGVTIEVSVVDQHGAPIPFAEVTTDTHPSSFTGHYTVDAQGHVSFTFQVNSSYTVCASDPATTIGVCNFNVNTPASGVVSVALVVALPAPPGNASSTAAPSSAARGWITGTVALTGSAVPVPGVTVQLANTPVSTQTGPDGRYQFAAVSTTDGADGGPAYTVAITPPAGYVVAGPASRAVTVVVGQGAEADFAIAPAFTPFWVESFVPSATLWSGPDRQAVAFGARPQWAHFLVAAPQQGPRLEVWDPLTKDYAWVDAAAVGPSGSPSP